MQRLEVSGAVRPLKGSLGFKGSIYSIAGKVLMQSCIQSSNRFGCHKLCIVQPKLERFIL